MMKWFTHKTPAVQPAPVEAAQQQATPPMPPPQMFHLTPVPHGLNPDGTLSLWVAVSVRLAGGDTLAAYPNLLRWPEMLQSGPLNITLRNDRMQTLNVTASAPTLTPYLWHGMFTEKTPVQSFRFRGQADKLIHTLGVRTSFESVKTLYQSVGLAYPRVAPPSVDLRPVLVGYNPALPAVERQRILQEVQQPGVFDMNATMRAPSPLGATTLSPADLKAHRYALLGALAHTAHNTGLKQSATMLRASSHSAAATFYGDLAKISGYQAQLTQTFQMYHSRALDSATMQSLPKPTRPTAPDFHQMLTAVGSFPALQRALGLVWEVSVPADFLASQRGTLTIQSVIVGHSELVEGPHTPMDRPTMRWMAGTQFVGATTAYTRTDADGRPGTRFDAAPSSEHAPSILNGTLALPESFGLLQLDVDGSLFKTSNAAVSVTTSLDIAAGAQDGLAALRGAGLALVQDKRAEHLTARLERTAALNDDLTSGANRETLYAEDLVRGYRFDIWDSVTRKWHSLHRRNERFRPPTAPGHAFTPTNTEGFSQLAVTQKVDDPSSLYLHEILARWAGWSLSAPRPGIQLSRSADPARAVPSDPAHDPDYVTDPTLSLITDITVAAGTLPKLRYGVSYRIRARVVDIAGGGVEFTDDLTVPAEAMSPAVPEGMPYLRHEPVAAPALLTKTLREVTDPGSDVTNLVIRTYNEDPSQDASSSVTPAERHILPPRVSAEIIERHGLLDDPSGHLSGDGGLFNLLTRADDFQFTQFDPATGSHLPKRGEPGFTALTSAQTARAVPVEPDPTALSPAPYLTDPLASGAAFTNLPGTDSNTLGWTDTLGAAVGTAGETLGQPVVIPLAPSGTSTALTVASLNGDTPRPGSVTLVDFGATPEWPNARGFTLALGAGSGAPLWNPTSRVLTISLPQAATATISLSSFVTPENLKLLAAWQWLREFADGHAQQLIERFTGSLELSRLLDAHAQMVAELVRSALEGGHHQLTPGRRVRLTHAVQKPIGHPQIVTLSANRAPGATKAALTGEMRVHGPSSAKIDLFATWAEIADAPEIDEGYTTKPTSMHVEEAPLHDAQGYGQIYAAGNPPRPVGQYASDPDRVVFAGGAQPLHEFHDTKHHVVSYSAVATSRFSDYFTNGKLFRQPDGTMSATPLKFTRESNVIQTHVPSSARPAAPNVRYVLPTFGWERQTSTNVKVSLRHGRGLRVYLEGPWFSSGEDELLGVVLYSGPASNATKTLPGFTHSEHAVGSAGIAKESLTIDAKGAGVADMSKALAHVALSPQLSNTDRERYKSYITQWGVDPIWSSASMYALPALGSFPSNVAQADGLSIPEANITFAVAGHAVKYDRHRGLWYCDLVVDCGDTYMPFIRLALARFQPHSISGMELSHVVLCDCAQLAADRAAIVTVDPYHPYLLNVTVSGPTPIAPRPTQVDISVQRRLPDVQSDLSWQTVGSDVAIVSRSTVAVPEADSGSTAWQGTISFAPNASLDGFRLVIQEYEVLDGDPDATPATSEGKVVHRLIYADIIELGASLATKKQRLQSGGPLGSAR
ncbi:MAG TPA: hypothetical protein VF792_00735 [Ktedonobacterales bacterium]